MNCPKPTTYKTSQCIWTKFQSSLFYHTKSKLTRGLKMFWKSHTSRECESILFLSSSSNWLILFSSWLDFCDIVSSLASFSDNINSNSPACNVWNGHETWTFASSHLKTMEHDRQVSHTLDALIWSSKTQPDNLLGVYFYEKGNLRHHTARPSTVFIVQQPCIILLERFMNIHPSTTNSSPIPYW